MMDPVAVVVPPEVYAYVHACDGGVEVNLDLSIDGEADETYPEPSYNGNEATLASALGGQVADPSPPIEYQTEYQDPVAAGDHLENLAAVEGYETAPGEDTHKPAECGDGDTYYTDDDGYVYRWDPVQNIGVYVDIDSGYTAEACVDTTQGAELYQTEPEAQDYGDSASGEEYSNTQPVSETIEEAAVPYEEVAEGVAPEESTNVDDGRQRDLDAAFFGVESAPQLLHQTTSDEHYPISETIEVQNLTEGYYDSAQPYVEPSYQDATAVQQTAYEGEDLSYAAETVPYVGKTISQVGETISQVGEDVAYGDESSGVDSAPCGEVETADENTYDPAVYSSDPNAQETALHQYDGQESGVYYGETSQACEGDATEAYEESQGYEGVEPQVYADEASPAYEVTATQDHESYIPTELEGEEPSVYVSEESSPLEGDAPEQAYGEQTSLAYDTAAPEQAYGEETSLAYEAAAPEQAYGEETSLAYDAGVQEQAYGEETSLAYDAGVQEQAYGEETSSAYDAGVQEQAYGEETSLAYEAGVCQDNGAQVPQTYDGEVYQEQNYESSQTYEDGAAQGEYLEENQQPYSDQAACDPQLFYSESDVTVSDASAYAQQFGAAYSEAGAAEYYGEIPENAQNVDVAGQEQCGDVLLQTEYVEGQEYHPEQAVAADDATYCYPNETAVDPSQQELHPEETQVMQYDAVAPTQECVVPVHTTSDDSAFAESSRCYAEYNSYGTVEPETYGEYPAENETVVAETQEGTHCAAVDYQPEGVGEVLYVDETYVQSDQGFPAETANENAEGMLESQPFQSAPEGYTPEYQEAFQEPVDVTYGEELQSEVYPENIMQNYDDQHLQSTEQSTYANEEQYPTHQVHEHMEHYSQDQYSEVHTNEYAEGEVVHCSEGDGEQNPEADAMQYPQNPEADAMQYPQNPEGDGAQNPEGDAEQYPQEGMAQYPEEGALQYFTADGVLYAETAEAESAEGAEAHYSEAAEPEYPEVAEAHYAEAAEAHYAEAAEAEYPVGAEAEYPVGAEAEYPVGAEAEYPETAEAQYSQGVEAEYSQGVEAEYSQGVEAEYSEGAEAQYPEGAGADGALCSGGEEVQYFGEQPDVEQYSVSEYSEQYHTMNGYSTEEVPICDDQNYGEDIPSEYSETYAQEYVAQDPQEYEAQAYSNEENVPQQNGVYPPEDTSEPFADETGSENETTKAAVSSNIVRGKIFTREMDNTERFKNFRIEYERTPAFDAFGYSLKFLGVRRGFVCSIRDDGVVNIQLKGDQLDKWHDTEFEYDASKPAEQIEVGKMYVIVHAFNGSDYMERCRVKEVEGDEALIHLLDTGCERKISTSQLYDIINLEEVESLPAQVIEIFVVGLTNEGYSKEELEQLEKEWYPYEEVFIIPVDAPKDGLLRAIVSRKTGETLGIRAPPQNLNRPI